MHQEILHFVYETEVLYPKYFNNARVLEIGSAKIGLQPSVRCRFHDCDYTGVDIWENSCVDVISKGHEYDSDKLFDTVCSFECFEHDMFWDLTLTNMIRLLRPGGLLIFSCATTGRPEHGTRSTDVIASPGTSELEGWQDYYRNLNETDFRKVPAMRQIGRGYWAHNEASQDIYYRGWKL